MDGYFSDQSKHRNPALFFTCVRVFRFVQFVRVANQKEAAIAARNMVDFVEATIEMISINLADEEKGQDAYEKAVGGEWWGLLAGRA